MARSAAFYEVSFGVEARTGHGEVIYVCGSCPSLGAKDPSRALRLTTDPSSYPLWSSEPVPVPLDTKVTYRYCIVAGGRLKRWEDISSDRIIEAVKEPSAAPVMLEDVIDEYKAAGGFLAGFFRGSGAPSGDMRRSVKFTAANRSSHQASMMKLRAKSKAKEDAAAITIRDGLVVVSFFLPVIVSKDEDGRWSVEWDHESLLSLHSKDINMRVTRVGFVRFADGVKPEEEEALTKALQPFSCVPIFLEKSLARKFYRDFCKGILWPAFHHVVDVYGDLVMRFFTQATLADLWQCYTTVNRRFRDKIVEVYNEGDMIWVHGFHLLLLPSFLTRVLRTARVGLFLHTPFPSSEIFRTLPFREDLLRGMLNADQIGFHLFEYARHFLTCSKRILGLNEGDSNNRGNTNVFYNGRCVSIESVHAGIEPNILRNSLRQDALSTRIGELKKDFAGRFVFIGIDKVERLKGLQLKFTAFYKLLLRSPHLASKICLLQIGISVHSREADYSKSLQELTSMANKANREFARSPDRPVLIFQVEEEDSFTLQKRLPYLYLGDCLLNTAVRDGLNRLPLEYVLVHHEMRKEDPGVLMLSEFTSCMRVMRGAIRINPWKVEDVAKVMADVVQIITLERRKHRHMQCIDFTLNNTTSFWAAQILTDLKAVHKSADRSIMSPVGLGLNFRVIGMESGFSPLDVSSVMRGYRPAKRRVIFVDYGGTLLTSENQRNIALFARATKLMGVTKPPDDLRQLLSTLCADARNLVFIVSGREKDELEEALGDIKNLGLAAEHGLHFRFPGEMRHPGPEAIAAGRGPSFVKRKWETLVAIRDKSWKQLTKTIMDLYVQRTHGTYLQEKGSALLWQFCDADPEFGWLQSKELEDHLTSVLKPFSLEILRGSGGNKGGGYIEVRPGGVNKGAFVSAVLERQVEAGYTPDFILAVGDEESDEMMFAAVEDFSRGVHGEAPSTPDTVAATASQKGPVSPSRRRGSYQVGATAAVLIASAAAELKRQQEEEASRGESDPASTSAALRAKLQAEEEKIGETVNLTPAATSQPGGARPRSYSERLTTNVPRKSVLAVNPRPFSERMRDGISSRAVGMGGPDPGHVPTAGVKCFTCTVGKKPSQARTYVNDIDEVIELLKGLVKVSSSVARNYSTSYLSEMRSGGGGGFANYDDLSVLSAQFHAEGSGEIDSTGHRVIPNAMAVGGMAGMMKSLSVVVMPTHLLPMRAAPTAPGTMSAYFQQIEEGDEEEEGGIFF